MDVDEEDRAAAWDATADERAADADLARFLVQINQPGSGQQALEERDFDPERAECEPEPDD